MVRGVHISSCSEKIVINDSTNFFFFFFSKTILHFSLFLFYRLHRIKISSISCDGILAIPLLTMHRPSCIVVTYFQKILSILFSLVEKPSFKSSLHFSWILLPSFLLLKERSGKIELRSRNITIFPYEDFSFYISVLDFLRESNKRWKKKLGIASSLSRWLLPHTRFANTWHGSIHGAVIYVCPRQSANQPRQWRWWFISVALPRANRPRTKSAECYVLHASCRVPFVSSPSSPFPLCVHAHVYNRHTHTYTPILRNGIVVKM